MSIVADEEQKTVRVRQGVLVICPKCGARCYAGSTQPKFTRYYCSSTTCSFSKKVPKPQFPDVQPE